MLGRAHLLSSFLFTQLILDLSSHICTPTVFNSKMSSEPDLSVLPTQTRPTTIYSLPPEILRHCLDQAPGKHKDRLLFFQTACLVCSTFRDEVKPLMWQVLMVWDEETALLVLSASDFGQYATRSLDLGGAMYEEDGVQGPSASAILLRVNGLERLRLLNFDVSCQLDYRVLCSSNLPNITTLILQHVHFTDNDPSNSALSPFQLKSLKLDQYESDSPNLYTVLSSSQLRRLDLRFTYDEDPDVPHQWSDLLSFFASIGGQLSWMKLQSIPSIAFTPVLAFCVNLQALHIVGDADEVPPLIRVVPSQVVTLTIEPHWAVWSRMQQIFEDFVKETCSLLNDKHLAKLVDLRVPIRYGDKQNFDAVATGPAVELRAQAERRGISLIWSE